MNDKLFYNTAKVPVEVYVDVIKGNLSRTFINKLPCTGIVDV